MEYRKETNGLLTFMENCWFPAIAFSLLIGSYVMTFFENLAGASWIRFLEASAVLLLLGASLILYAKIPVYRSDQFFTFGIKSIPVNLKSCYRWGWRIFLFGVLLSLCLLLSEQ